MPPSKTHIGARASQFPVQCTCQTRNPSNTRLPRRICPKLEKCPNGQKIQFMFFSRPSPRPRTIHHFPLSLATLLVHVHPCTCCTPRPSVARRANSKQRHQRRVCTKTVVRVPRPKRTCRARTRLPRPGNEISRRNLARACMRRRF